MDTSVRPIGLHPLLPGVCPEPTLFTGGVPEYGKECTDMGSTAMIELDDDVWIEPRTITIIAGIIMVYVILAIYIFRDRVFI